MIHRAYRYRLYPTPEQESLLWQFAGTARFVYNLALEQRRDWWRQYAANTGRRLNFASQGPQVTQLRKEVDWIRAAPVNSLHKALQDLDRAFANFYAGRAAYPRPRCRGENDAFRVAPVDSPYRRINAKWSEVRLPKGGWVRVRDTRPAVGRTVSVTFKHSSNGWHVVFSNEVELDVAATSSASVGIDRGIANTLALSTGEMMSVPSINRLDRQKRRAQRVMMRRQRGSERHRKQCRRMGRISGKIARVRADWCHRATTDLARRFSTVALEDLKTVNMTRSGKGKRGLNRSILAQGWAQFATALAYKLEERGGALIKVNPAYTSQTCSECGTIDKASRESQASFACRHCGFAAHADTNAAINILRRSTASMRGEGSAYAPVEPRTINLAA